MNEKSTSKNKILKETLSILKLFLPLLFSQVIYAASTFISTIMVGHLGKIPLAALGLASITYSTLCVFFFGIFVGISILVARNHGSGNDKNIKNIVSQGFILAIICSIPFMLIMWFIPKCYHLIEDCTKEVRILATSYLHSLTLSVLPWLFLVVIEQFLIGIALAKVIVFISIIQVIFEVLINYILVFGKWGFPKYGIVGLGYGFTILFVTSLAFIGLYVKNSSKTKHYDIFKNFLKLKSNVLLDLIKIGLSIGFTNVVETLFFLCLTFLIVPFGISAIAGQQIIRQYFELTVTIGLAMTQVATVRVSIAIGEKKNKNLKTPIFISSILVVILMIFFAIIYIIFPEFLIAFDIDINDSNFFLLINYTKKVFMILAIYQIFDSIRLVMIGALRAFKDSKIPMYITLFTFWILGLSFAYVFGFYLKLGWIGLWIGILIAMILGTISLFIRLKFILNKSVII
ncbi:MAG: MATE family efflux transporter [Bacteroidetes bacterium]|nr:MATE family efflux transporter [Bacteroidota bacterium]